MIKRYIINQMTELSAWIGAMVILSALFLPRSCIIFLGIALIVTDDNWLRERFAKGAKLAENAMTKKA